MLKRPSNRSFATYGAHDPAGNYIYEGAGIDRPGIEHLGFKVESVEAVKNELAALRERNPEMRERIIAEPSEGERRTALIAGCRHGRYVTSSPDGMFVEVCG